MLHSVRMQHKLAKLRLHRHGSIISANNGDEESALTDTTSTTYPRTNSNTTTELEEDPSYRPGVVAGSIHGYSEYDVESLTITVNNGGSLSNVDTQSHSAIIHRSQVLPNMQHVTTRSATAQGILQVPRHNAHSQSDDICSNSSSPIDNFTDQRTSTANEGSPSVSDYVLESDFNYSSSVHTCDKSLTHSLSNSQTIDHADSLSSHNTRVTHTTPYVHNRCYYGADWESVQHINPPNTPANSNLDNASLHSETQFEQSQLEQHIISFIIKKGSSTYLTIQYPSLFFTDILQYLSEGVTLTSYLKCFGDGCSEVSKMPYPYSWIDRPSRLKCRKLPARRHFHNALKGTRVSKAEYQCCRALWVAENCTTFSDFTRLYNISDVDRLPQCIAKHVDFFKTLQIDMWRDGLSLPAIAMRYLFSTLDKGIYFVLVDRKNEDFYWKLRGAVQGGLSIVFQRKAVLGEQTLRPNGKVCRLIKCLDTCSLYLGVLQFEMPVNHFCFYNAPNFRRQKCHEYGLMSLEWMTCYSRKHNVPIWNKYSKNVEYRVLGRPVDGYIVETNTILEYCGCIWHGCPFGDDICGANYKFNTDGTIRTHNPVNKKLFTDLYNETMLRHAALTRAHYNLEIMWEHDWLVERHTPHNKTIIDTLFYNEKFHPKGPMSQDRLIQLIKSGSIYGYGEVTMHCPSHLKEAFADYPPFYKNTEIDITMIGDHMADFARSRGLMKQPIKSLILSYHVEKTFLLTPLIQWYLQQNLVVDSIHSFYSFKPEKCFTKFVDTIVAARRAADIDPNKRILGELSKYVGNAAIGRSIMQKERHKTIHIANDAQASGFLNNPKFHEIEQIGDDCFEVFMNKKFVRHDLPVQVGQAVYSLSKLIQLQFIHNFILKFWHKSDVTLLNHDTDSWWLAMSNSNMENIIIPSLRKEYFQNVHKFLPGMACAHHHDQYVDMRTKYLEWDINSYPCCVAHNKREQHTPMLYKTEADSREFIALNAKSYHSTDLHDPLHSKQSTKGISKVHSHLEVQDFRDVLTNKEPKKGVNKSFITKDSNIYSYEQTRIGLSYLYIKRIVQPDGWTTLPTEV